MASPEVGVVRRDVDVEPEFVFEYELPAAYQGEEAPADWNEAAAESALAGLEATLAATVSAYDNLPQEGGDDRSQHIAEACNGERWAYGVAVGGFVASATATIGGGLMFGPAAAWGGVKASLAALGAANVALAYWNSCKYKEGKAWDQDHPEP